MQIKLNGEELNTVDHFKYLRSVIDKYGTIDRYVDLRVQAALGKVGEIDRSIVRSEDSLRFKLKVYEAITRPRG